MAIVQISKIQIRRGLANQGTGLPQLASGEMAWSLDTQELWIGNGAVSEGAPAVGNTKILTIHDVSGYGNILNIISYTYKPNAALQSGPNGTQFTRLVQDKLDERVSLADFGTTADGQPAYDNLGNFIGYVGTDDTQAIQRAIDQLYLNNPSANILSGSAYRVTLEIPPGVYIISSTLYIPSYVTLKGAGSDKTIFYYTPGASTNPFVQFVNDTSIIGVPSGITTTTYNNQPRSINISGMTFEIISGSNTAFEMDAVRDSIFEDIKFNGHWAKTSSPSNNSIALNMKLYQGASMATCEFNTFKNVKFNNFTMMVSALQDIKNNIFDNCTFYNAYAGIYLGEDIFGNLSDGTTTGQTNGPREIQIINSRFENIKKHGIMIYRGSINTVQNCKFINVGSMGAGVVGAEYPEIFFGKTGNTVENVYSDRSSLATSNITTLYVPEVAGNGIYRSYGVTNIYVGQQSNYQYLFRLPAMTTSDGTPSGTIVYTLDYSYVSTTSSFSRRGTMTIAADINNIKIQSSDDFDFAGADPTDSIAIQLDFQASFIDATGTKYTGAVGQQPSGIGIYYVNNQGGDYGYMTYSYSAIFHSIS